MADLHLRRTLIVASATPAEQYPPKFASMHVDQATAQERNIDSSDNLRPLLWTNFQGNRSRVFNFDSTRLDSTFGGRVYICSHLTLSSSYLPACTQKQDKSSIHNAIENGNTAFDVIALSCRVDTRLHRAQILRAVKLNGQKQVSYFTSVAQCMQESLKYQQMNVRLLIFVDVSGVNPRPTYKPMRDASAEPLAFGVHL